MRVDKRSNSAARLHEIQARYGLRDSARVFGFLSSHPALIGFLIQAVPHVQEHFNQDVQVVLEVVSDPESTGEKLFGYICLKWSRSTPSSDPTQ